jgi:hypothetical protein
MSEKEKQKPTERPGPKDAAGAADKEGRVADEPKKKLDYVFKIVPVDPKNSFDFEDVADK